MVSNLDVREGMLQQFPAAFTEQMLRALVLFGSEYIVASDGLYANGDYSANFRNGTRSFITHNSLWDPNYRRNTDPGPNTFRREFYLKNGGSSGNRNLDSTPLNYSVYVYYTRK